MKHILELLPSHTAHSVPYNSTRAAKRGNSSMNTGPGAYELYKSTSTARIARTLIAHRRIKCKWCVFWLTDGRCSCWWLGVSALTCKAVQRKSSTWVDVTKPCFRCEFCTMNWCPAIRSYADEFHTALDNMMDFVRFGNSEFKSILQWWRLVQRVFTHIYESYWLRRVLGKWWWASSMYSYCSAHTMLYEWG